MAEVKTKPTNIAPADFLASLENPRRREDGEVLMRLMAEITGERPVMWGPTMIGFGSMRYQYDSGHGGETFRVGFAPRKPHLVIYNWSYFPGANNLIARLGKLKKSVACLYVNKLADIDMAVLRELLDKGYRYTFTRSP
jgi:hypothetical protein